MAASEISKWQTQLAEDAGISLSAVAKQIRAQVTRPQRQRDPVGYKDAFLDDYQPNQSAYLSESIRQDLAQEGHVGASQLPAGTYVRKVLDRWLIDLSWNSSRLEGNTYSILEAQRLLELGEASDGKATVEAQMLLNHKAAIELLADQVDEIGFNHYTICNLHALLADNLMPDPDSCGRIRERSVGIAASVYYPPEGHLRIKERFNVFLEKAEAIENPFEQAFFAMVHLPYLQAFEDVNKRVSRLAANIPLVRHNLCPLSFVDVPQSDYVHAILGVYELNRIEYLREVFVWPTNARQCAARPCAKRSASQTLFAYSIGTSSTPACAKSCSKITPKQRPAQVSRPLHTSWLQMLEHNSYKSSRSN
ncbi:Fic family protein [Coraliomargarita sp. SDUM461003]|uniref:Fic family protein n=1 Tax=Thalassobacterium maritimum TaxID=3041265 RepID=A0ABU1AYL2_9BACT|nr:Fic family protein [Coraliomargarita sp. SDUM461003]MDQ8208205.1 Fic family protein [Coraliomargarita sp. SDUM461003]